MEERITERDWHDAKFKDAARSLIANYERAKLKKLWDFENGLEDGTIIRLPCKVGDTLYEVFKDHKPAFIKETTVDKIVFTAKGIRLKLARNSFYETAISSIGKTLFLSKEEAEKKLAEIEGKSYGRENNR